MKSYEVIVIGAGHNGLVAASLLAKAGRRVLVVDAAESPGGMAASGEFVPGVPAPILPHSMPGPAGSVAKQLELARHGFASSGSIPRTICLSPAEPPLVLEGIYALAACNDGETDQAGWQNLRKRLLLQASLLQRFLEEVPPQEGKLPLSGKAKLATAALRLKSAGRTEMQEFLRMAMMPIADILEEHLEDDRLKGLLAFDATLGIALGPRSPTSVLGIYMRLANMLSGNAQLHSVLAPQSLMTAIRNSASANGVEFRLSSKVARIETSGGAACGIVLESGESISARTVISAVHPKTTFLELVGAPKLDTGFARDVSSIRTRGNVSKYNLVLDAPPSIKGLAGLQENARHVFAPSIAEVEEAFNPSKYGELPQTPCFEFVVEPLDEGRFALSICIQNTPFNLKEGWENGRNRIMASVMGILEELAPGLSRSVVASRFLSPVDIEGSFHSPGGHWHHGELQIDRMFSLRPVFGSAGYATPIDHLYVCSAGTHPGGGLTGLPGFNAARAVLSGEGG